MSTREKIIVILMGLSVVYGVYTLVASDQEEPVPSDISTELQELEKMVREIGATIADNELSRTEKYTVERAEARWGRDPYRAPHEVEGEEAPEVSLTYTGYLESGGKRLAVVNGLEYQTGEELEMGGFLVEEIRPDRVIIAVKGKRQQIIVPLEE